MWIIDIEVIHMFKTLEDTHLERFPLTTLAVIVAVLLLGGLSMVYGASFPQLW